MKNITRKVLRTSAFALALSISPYLFYVGYVLSHNQQCQLQDGVRVALIRITDSVVFEIGNFVSSGYLNHLKTLAAQRNDGVVNVLSLKEMIGRCE